MAIVLSAQRFIVKSNHGELVVAGPVRASQRESNRGYVGLQNEVSTLPTRLKVTQPNGAMAMEPS